jgi:very-short-patch-repair endonuclease
LKFIDLQGKLHSKNVDVYKYGRRAVSRSQFQHKVGKRLQELFPTFTILEEMPVWGTSLKLDFYIHGLRLAIEADGIQHDEYVPFFHGSKEKFAKGIRNDANKERWCEINCIKIIRINEENFENMSRIIWGMEND